MYRRGDWRAMFLDRPHLRFDGVYVSRNTYIRRYLPRTGKPYVALATALGVVEHALLVTNVLLTAPTPPSYKWLPFTLSLPSLDTRGACSGVAEYNVKKAVHLAVYYRYFRFLPDAQFAYRTSPESVARVAKSLRILPRTVKMDGVQKGRYKLVVSALVWQHAISQVKLCNQLPLRFESQWKLRFCWRAERL